MHKETIRNLVLKGFVDVLYTNEKYAYIYSLSDLNVMCLINREGTKLTLGRVTSDTIEWFDSVLSEQGSYINDINYFYSIYDKVIDSFTDSTEFGLVNSITMDCGHIRCLENEFGYYTLISYMDDFSLMPLSEHFE